MKKLHKLICAVLCISLFLSGCSFDNNLENQYDANQNLSIGVTDNMITLPIETMANTHAVIPFDSYVYSNVDGKYMASLLVNTNSKDIVQCSNPHKRIYPASMTKVMTAMIVADQINDGKLSLNDTVTITHDITFSDIDATGCGLKSGDVLTVDTLLHGLLIRSFNDCCIALAEKVAGSEEEFVEMMNQKALELGATNTHFENSHGLHSNNHYTTVYDLYLMFSEFTTYETLGNIDNLKSYVMRYNHIDGTPVEIECSPTNGFVGEYDLPDGLTMHGWKTGTTSQAGSCLIMEVSDEEDNMYIAVIANAKDKSTLYEEMVSMLENINE